MTSKTFAIAAARFTKRCSAGLASLLVVGCTKANPDYCSIAMDCSNGYVCDLTTHACTAEPLVDAPMSSPDAAAPECDVTKPFAPAVEVAGLRDSMANDAHASLTGNELTVYFATNRFNYSTPMRIYKATRSTREAAFGSPTPIAELINTDDMEGENNPTISPDGNTIFFDVYRASGGLLLMSTRSDPSSAFPTPQILSNQNLVEPTITADAQTLYASNLQTGTLSRLQSVDGTFGAAQPAGVQTGYTQLSPATSDDLTLYMTFQSGALYASKRASTTEPWPTPLEVTELNTHDGEFLPSWVSANGCRLYLTYAPAGMKSRIYMAERPK